MVSERVQRQIERLLDEAEEAVARLDWETVRARAQAVLAFDPENSDGLDFLAAAERATEDVSEPSPQATVSALPPSAPSQPLPTFFKDGRYMVKQFLGEGAHKRVYLVHDTLIDRDVAFALIKTETLDDIGRQRILREAQTMGRLGEHTNLVPIYEFGDESGQLFMVIPAMTHGSVTDLIRQSEDRRVGLDRIVEIATDVCNGLEFLHSREVVHRDLKPSNVWLSERGTARLGDFGLAVSAERSSLTNEGMAVGTVSYMAPEQAMGGEIDARSDLYSLGCMLYEMVTGAPPFQGSDPVAIIGQHVNTPPVAPSRRNSLCPRLLDSLILKLLSKDPSDRPHSASEVVGILEAIDPGDSADFSGGDSRRSNALDSLASGVFVGRDQEMAELRTALNDALSGQGSLAMLVGEPGIGKTRMASELETYANLRGVKVLWGRCHEQQGMPPFWPWVQAIRSYVREREPEQLRSDMGAGASTIAEIVSDVNEFLPELKPQPELENPEQARFRLFDAITTFLKNISTQSNALVLILDDLHWADTPSLQLLEFLSQELFDSHLMVIGMYRDVDLSRQHPLAETLGQLTRARLFQRVALRGLSLEDEGQMIQATSGEQPNQEFVELVHSRTEGNPLFISEVLRMLEQEGGIAQDTADVRIPEGVREVIGRRLNRLPEQCNQALTVASVIGREFEFAQLVRLMEGVSEDGLLESLEEALSARVIEEAPQSVGRYQFTHALIQQTLMDELSTTRRVRLSVRIIDVFEELYEEGIDAHAVQMAYHAAEAEAIIGPDKLLRYSIVAGERDLKAYAFESALAHFQRALDAREGQPMDSESAAIVFGLGQAEAMTLKSDEAVSHWKQAFDFYVEAEDIRRAVTVAGMPILGRGGADMAALIEQALDLIPVDSIEAGRLLSIHGRHLGMNEGDYAGAQQAFERALAIAERENDLLLKFRALANACNVESFHLRHHESLGKSLSAIELAGVVDSPRDESMAHIIALSGRMQNRDTTRANRHGEACQAAAERLRDRERLSTACSAHQAVAQAEGNWEAARALNDRALASWPYDPRTLSGRALLECQVGDYDEAEYYLERLLETTHTKASGELLEHTNSAANPTANSARTIPMVSHITGVTDRLDIAKAAAETVLSSPHAVPVWVISARTGLALMAFMQDDASAAAQQYSALEPQRGTILTGVAALSGEICIDRVLGLLSQTMGKTDDAVVHFEESLEFCREAGYRPELAWACHDYANMLIQRNVSGDLSKARELLDESHQIASDLGMEPLNEKVTALRERLDARPASKPQYPDGLTEREVEVLRLVAAGRTNREIAEILFISVNTVHRHVSHIFSKTDSANRAEAATYANQHGLI